ncbi:MAG: hypothetical protein KDA61_19390, partial [Planctomycetales bacterium]|nr:hypothetical protein [Planctomycetales bacterium]
YSRTTLPYAAPPASQPGAYTGQGMFGAAEPTPVPPTQPQAQPAGRDRTIYDTARRFLKRWTD